MEHMMKSLILYFVFMITHDKEKQSRGVSNKKERIYLNAPFAKMLIADI